MLKNEKCNDSAVLVVLGLLRDIEKRKIQPYCRTIVHLYNCVRRDREGKQGGGVAIYCRESLNFTEQEDLMNANESVWIKINRTRCKPLIIGNVYRAPDQPVDTFLDNLNESLFRIDSTSDKVLLGDFNIYFSVQQKNANFPLKRRLPPQSCRVWSF